MKKKYGGWILALIVLAIAAGFLINRNQKTPTKNPEGEKLQVAASFYPLYFLASSIGGDKVAVINITPAGAEPHDYEPTAEDIAHIENSRILILDGTGLEAWGSNIQKNIDLKKTNIIVTGEGLITRTVMENGKNVTDPRSEEHTSELQSPDHLVCRLLLEKKKKRQRANRQKTYQTILDKKKIENAIDKVRI